MKNVFILCLCLSCILLTACDNNSKDIKEISYPKYPDTGGLEEHSNANNHINHDEEEKETDHTDMPVKDTNNQNSQEELQPLTSRHVQSDYGNLGINLKHRNNLSLVCPAPDSDAIYYVNYGEDDFIYKLEGGQSTLVVAKKANFIQLWNNELYFLSDNTNLKHLYKTENPQNIYKYNLDTQELTLILETNAIWLFINPDGIYFDTCDEEIIDEFSSRITTYSFQLDFNDTLPQKTQYLNYYPEEEFALKFTNAGLVIYNKDSGYEVIAIPISYANHNACIYGDILYYVNEDKLYTLNLFSGEKKTYDVKNYVSSYLEEPSASSHWQYINDYSVMNGEIFILCNGEIIFRVDMASGNITKMVVEPEGGGIPEIYKDSDVDPKKILRNSTKYRLDRLYTSKDRLFATVEYDMDKDEELRKLIELIVTNESITVKELIK